ncbi:MAG: DegV family protein [Erysipelotrichaceae bacterium]|nr:DegV family protein [Erysipelotrichaceae bacterium]
MAFYVFADGTANLPGSLLDGITLLPSEYLMDGEPRVYTGDIDHFDVKTYYEGLRSGVSVKTSLLNTGLFLTHFTPLLQNGGDVIYIAMSSGISGTYNAARLAAEQLNQEFPDRFVHIVDSQGCGFGNGMLAIRAAQLSKEGTEVHEAARILDEMVPHCCQYFTVDDLNFLKKTGRVSGATAAIATTLNIKPILYGDKTGHIVSCAIAHGRKRSIKMLAGKYHEKRLDLEEPDVYISNGDCEEDAEMLKELILEETPKAKITICPHEPFSGAHVGPGMLGLFFLGKER